MQDIASARGIPDYAIGTKPLEILTHTSKAYRLIQTAGQLQLKTCKDFFPSSVNTSTLLFPAAATHAPRWKLRHIATR